MILFRFQSSRIVHWDKTEVFTVTSSIIFTRLGCLNEENVGFLISLFVALSGKAVETHAH